MGVRRQEAPPARVGVRDARMARIADARLDLRDRRRARREPHARRRRARGAVGGGEQHRRREHRPRAALDVVPCRIPEAHDADRGMGVAVGRPVDDGAGAPGESADARKDRYRRGRKSPHGEGFGQGRGGRDPSDGGESRPIAGRYLWRPTSPTPLAKRPLDAAVSLWRGPRGETWFPPVRLTSCRACRPASRRRRAASPAPRPRPPRS